MKLGIYLEETKERNGLTLVNYEWWSPLKSAGMKLNDVILLINDNPLDSLQDFNELEKVIDNENSHIRIKYKNKKGTFELDVKPADLLGQRDAVLGDSTNSEIIDMPNQKDTSSNNKGEYNGTNDLALYLKIAGTLYFIFSFIASIILFANTEYERFIPGGSLLSSGNYEKGTNYLFISLGIAGLLSGVIILFLCLGVAKIIEQNRKILINLIK